MPERTVNKRLRLQEAARAQKNGSEWRKAVAEARQALGAKVRKLRQGKGWSQEEFAWLSGLHPSHLGAIERGTHDLGIATIIRLAQPFDMQASILLKGVA